MDKFTELYATLHRRLRFAVRRFVDNPVDVEDVVQEAYLKSLEREKIAPIANHEAYVSVAARNLALNYLREAGVRQLIEFSDDTLEDALQNQSSADAELDADRRFRLYCEAVETLPKQCRRVFTLKHVYGYTQKEIGAYLKVSEKTVEYHVAQGLQRVRDYMSERTVSGTRVSTPSESGCRRV